MIATMITMAGMGLILGLFLGVSAYYLKVEAEPIIEEITDMLPGSNCGQCGFPGCAQAAAGLVAGEASVTLCPPGGKGVVEALAERLGIDAPTGMEDALPMLALVSEATCIGCTRCSKVCPTDAIVGAPKQIHAVINSACNGCKLCVDVCPTECLQLVPEQVTLDNWRWQRPALAAAA